MIERLLALLQGDDVGDLRAELRTLQYWAAVDRFDRRALNRQLRQDVATQTEPAASTQEAY